MSVFSSRQECKRGNQGKVERVFGIRWQSGREACPLPGVGASSDWVSALWLMGRHPPPTEKEVWAGGKVLCILSGEDSTLSVLTRNIILITRRSPCDPCFFCLLTLSEKLQDLLHHQTSWQKRSRASGVSVRGHRPSIYRGWESQHGEKHLPPTEAPQERSYLGSDRQLFKGARHRERGFKAGRMLCMRGGEK